MKKHLALTSLSIVASMALTGCFETANTRHERELVEARNAIPEIPATIIDCQSGEGPSHGGNMMKYFDLDGDSKADAVLFIRTNKSTSASLQDFLQTHREVQEKKTAPLRSFVPHNRCFKLEFSKDYQR